VTTTDADWPLGLAWIAHVLARDLQRAAREAGGPEALWAAPGARMGAVLHSRPDVARRATGARDGFRARAMRAELGRMGITHVPITSPEYPDRLRMIFDPPFGLFGTDGMAAALRSMHGAPCVAIVGSRRPTGAGRQLARIVARDLAARGAVIISGLARGIDAEAHEGALEAGGVTIAVLGSGVDRVHPRRHLALAGRIARDGAVVSEYWPGTDPAPWRFPARNRIVAGMADAVVVVEAAARSGALITADFAMENGTPVLAVPGWPGAAMSAGCNALLRAGAALCEGADDVVAEVRHGAWREAPVPAAASGTDAAVRAVVAREPIGADAVAAATGLSAAEVAVALARLEISGLVARDPGGLFRAVAAAPRAERGDAGG
jgi:DNA processing protein